MKQLEIRLSIRDKLQRVYIERISNSAARSEESVKSLLFHYGCRLLDRWPAREVEIVSEGRLLDREPLFCRVSYPVKMTVTKKLFDGDSI